MTLYYTLRRFWFVPQLVERRLGAEGSPVRAGLPADAGAVAVGRDRDGSVVEAKGRGDLRPWPPRRAGHNALLRLRLRLVLRSVNPEDLRALLAPQLLHLEVVHGARLLHLVARLAREASLSVPPPAAALQPIMCEAAFSPPSIAQAVPTSAAPAEATARPPPQLFAGSLEQGLHFGRPAD